MTDGLFTFGTLETMEVPIGGPTAFKGSTIIPKAPVGSIIHYNGNTYRYVRFVAENTSSNFEPKTVVYWLGLDPPNGIFDVTDIITNAIGAGINLVAGVCQHDIDYINAAGGTDFGIDPVTGFYYAYGYIQVGGVATAKTAANTVVGDGCIYGTTGTFGREAHGAFNNEAFGIAMDSQNTTSGTNTVWLQNLIW